MKSTYKKKLERAALLIREVYDDFESEEAGDFDDYGTRLDDLAGGIEDLLAEDEANRNAKDEDDDEDKCYEVE